MFLDFLLLASGGSMVMVGVTCSRASSPCPPFLCPLARSLQLSQLPYPAKSSSGCPAPSGFLSSSPLSSSHSSQSSQSCECNNMIQNQFFSPIHRACGHPLNSQHIPILFTHPRCFNGWDASYNSVQLKWSSICKAWSSLPSISHLLSRVLSREDTSAAPQQA